MQWGYLRKICQKEQLGFAQLLGFRLNSGDGYAKCQVVTFVKEVSVYFGGWSFQQTELSKSTQGSKVTILDKELI